MIENIKALIQDNFSEILEKLPYPCMIFIDPAAHWDIAEFEIVWFNKSAKELLGSYISGGKIRTTTDQKMNQYTEILRGHRNRMMDGKEAFFIGPYGSTFINDSGIQIKYKWHAMYLGEFGLAHPAFLFLLQGQTLE
jgi:hypothetical protein